MRGILPEYYNDGSRRDVRGYPKGGGYTAKRTPPKPPPLLNNPNSSFPRKRESRVP